MSKRKHHKDLDLILKLGNKVKMLRKSKQLTQSDVAHSLDIDDSSYRKIENGKANCTLSTLKKISDVFEIPLSELVSFN